MTNAIVGQVYYSGNTLYPTECRVLSVTVTAPARVVRSWSRCGHTPLEGELWVKHTNSGWLRGALWTPMCVWLGTRHASEEALVASRVEV